MTATTNRSSRPFEQIGLSQFKAWTILLMFAWPAVWYMILIYGFGQLFIPDGGTTPTRLLLLIMTLGGGSELTVGLILLRREGYQLTVNALRDRIRIRWPKGWKAWTLAVIVFVIGLGLSMAMGPVNRMLATVPGFVPPRWWGPASNPTVEVHNAADVFPDVNLTGNYLFVLLYFLIGLVFNIFGEEIYYRGCLLPRMRGVFGRWDWAANGVLFTLKHFYQRWMYPGIFVGGLSFTFAAGPLGSLPLAMVYHWIGNFLFQIIFLIQAVMGAG